MAELFLLGTPNHGSEFADVVRDKWWAKIAGPTALSLGTDDDSFPNSLHNPYYPVGVIAGIAKHDMDDRIIPGQDDGVVAIDATKLEGMTDFTVVQSGNSMMRYDPRKIS